MDLVQIKERRRAARFECEGQAAVLALKTGVRFQGKIQDLSIQGCLLKADKTHNLSVYELVEITFNVNQEPFRVRAHVRVIRECGSIGFQFELPSERTTRRLESLVDELAVAAANKPPGAKPEPRT
jgi:hypothetical protein